jgi:hypothetical protein
MTSAGRREYLTEAEPKQACEEDTIVTLFEPTPPDDRPPLHSKAFEREMGVLFILGPALVFVGLVYLLSFLGD